ncbi:hypothetical protein NP493_13g12020 [Ridgeia piscesae]|uniref:Ammonium transporter AmtB-like domain-containing protein n=1 Tax=Ridgeia piscesae TaxID=27915 RepID=A0AAD9UL90_RIDPI|nr:hypothetical protein NP493_13g12020 [Ridgeia piscesae]
MATTNASTEGVVAGRLIGSNSTFSNDGSQMSNSEDAIWILSCTFIIFTMQSGFGLLESGLVSKKDEVNIMMKNAIDVIVGGLSFWLFGYAFSFGDGVDSLRGFSGGNRFMLMASEGDTKADAGTYYARFFFQSSFATTATTIVSGG